MSAFERAWLFLKQGGLPNLFGDDDDDETKKPGVLPDIFDASGNIASDKPKPAQKVSAQPTNQLSAPAISQIGEGPQLAILGHRDWGLMGDDTYPKEALYQDMDTFDDKMQEWIALHGMPSHIITGGFGGTDELAQQWADDNGVEMTVHPPDFRGDGRWNALGARNDRIIDAASHALLFPHPMGTATQDAHMKANKKGIPVHSHSITSPSSVPLRDGGRPEKKEQPHWYREFMGDMGAKVMPEGRSRLSSKHGDTDRLTAAMRRVHGKEFAQGKMRTQTARDRENRTSSGRVEGFPMRAPFTAASGRHIPKDTRTDEEKQYDRLIDMARESGSQIQMEPRVGGGQTKEQQLEEIRESKRLSNEEALQARAMGNLPIPRGPSNPEQEHLEAQMHEDLAAMREGRQPRKIKRKISAHRGTRGGRQTNEESSEELPDLFGGGEESSADEGDLNNPDENDLAAKELQRRIAYNHTEPTRARQAGRRQQPLPLTDDEGMLIELDDPHWIEDLRFQKMLKSMSPIDRAFALIKGYSHAR